MIEWNSSYSIGIDEIDEQHKIIIDQVNKLSDCLNKKDSDKEIGQVLKTIVDYINIHFSCEEKFMKEINYPLYFHQKEFHSEFTKKVASYLMKLKHGNKVTAREIMAFLITWFNEHIKEEDKKIGVWYENQYKPNLVKIEK